MTDECLKWARDAPTEEARQACLLLARIWLKSAMREEDAKLNRVPLASTVTKNDELPSCSEASKADIGATDILADDLASIIDTLRNLKP